MAGQDELRAQFRALAFGDTRGVIGGVLATAPFRAGREFPEVQVADAEFDQPLLEPLTVHKGILSTAHAVPETDVAKRVHACRLQGGKRGLRSGAVNAERDRLGQHTGE